MTHTFLADVIDQLTDTRAGGHVDALRARRPQARLQAQKSYLALFEPDALPSGEGSAFTPVERFAVAAFVARLHGQVEIAGFYADKLASGGAAPGLQQAIDAEAAAGLAPGPYGRYPAGPLSREDAPGPVHAVDDAARSVLGPRLSAALAHAHLLVLHPRDADAAALRALLDAGWSTTDIVTLSQLVAFLTFQIRVVVGLRSLASHPESLATA